MKAKIKYNGEVIDVIQVGTKTHLFDLNNVEFIDAPVDYWERLRHQYAGQAMQALLSHHGATVSPDWINEEAEAFATALVEKLKSESK